MTAHFRVGEYVLHQRVDEGMLVVETRTLTYIELDSVGTDMWEAVCDTSDLEAAVARITALYDVDPDTASVDLGKQVDRWVELGLGVIADGSESESAENRAVEDRDIAVGSSVSEPADLYLDLMVKVLCGLTAGGIPSLGARLAGRDIPDGDPAVFTMIGIPRLQNIRAVIQRALDDDIPGDLMECGVWRGGATIFMRAVLAARQVHDRTVWVADSFAGLPEVPTDGHPADKATWAEFSGCFAASEAAVRSNFELFSLLDNQVRFVPGWFEDSLPHADVEQLAVLRLDGDLYSSTMTALTHLYPKVAPGGFVIIDDYNLRSCRTAVHDYLEAHGYEVELHPIDWAGVWWRKPAAGDEATG